MTMVNGTVSYRGGRLDLIFSSSIRKLRAASSSTTISTPPSREGMRLCPNIAIFTILSLFSVHAQNGNEGSENTTTEEADTPAPNAPKTVDVSEFTIVHTKDEISSAIAQMLKEKIDKGETGVTAGKGFYDYTK